MDYKVLKEADFSVSNWTGGKTKQLAIFPEDSNYLERDFTWRLSSATVEQEESDFSKLPDFDRILMVLEGEVVLAHQGERVARLKQYEQDSFDGAYKTKSFGKITDYNLMTRKGNKGFVTYIKAAETATAVTFHQTEGYQFISHGFYCPSGYAVINLNGQDIMVNAGELLVINGKQSDKLNISLMGDGAIIQSEVYYNDDENIYAAVKIKSEPATFKDFLDCIYLSNVQFRGARFIIKKLKNQWLDEALGDVVRKLEKGCVTFFTYIVGAVALVLLTYQNWASNSILLAELAWLIVDCLLISPLIYFAFVPKPVRKHIKDVDNLTPYERDVREMELSRNERVEKLMKNTVTYNKDVDDLPSITGNFKK